MFSAKKLPMSKPQIYVETGTWIAFSLALLWIPFSWLLSWFVAASIHECFHIIALKICNVQIEGIRIGPLGAGIRADLKPGLCAAFCAMAGPLAGGVLLLLVHIFPKVAICGLLQTMVNLIPIHPLDGSRVVSGLIYAIFDRNKARNISNCIDRFSCVAVGVLLCYAAFRFQLGWIPVLLLPVLVIKKKLLANQGT